MIYRTEKPETTDQRRHTLLELSYNWLLIKTMFSTTLSTTLSTEKQGLDAINKEKVCQILKGLYDQGGAGKCISLGSGPRGRRFKSYRPDLETKGLRD
jgi:hypothetical protein